MPAFDYQHGTGDSVEFTYDAPSAGDYLLEFRYANGPTSDALAAPLTLYDGVDHVDGMIACHEPRVGPVVGHTPPDRDAHPAGHRDAAAGRPPLHSRINGEWPHGAFTSARKPM